MEKWEHYIADGIVTHNCLYGWKEGAAHYFVNERTNTTVIDELESIDIEKLNKKELVALLKKMTAELLPTVMNADKPNRNGVHPTMKPVLLIAQQIEKSSRIGETVADGFLGSGTTMVASHQLSRFCKGMELGPVYCDVIIQRMLLLDPTIRIITNGLDTTEYWQQSLTDAQINKHTHGKRKDTI